MTGIGQYLYGQRGGSFVQAALVDRNATASAVSFRAPVLAPNLAVRVRLHVVAGPSVQRPAAALNPTRGDPRAEVMPRAGATAAAGCVHGDHRVKVVLGDDRLARQVSYDRGNTALGIGVDDPPAVSLARQDLFQPCARPCLAIRRGDPASVQLRNQRVLRLSGEKSRCQITQNGSLIFAHGDQVGFEPKRPMTTVRFASQRPELLAASAPG